MFDNNTFDKAHSHSPDDVKPHRPQTTTNCCTTVRVTSPHFEADRTLQRDKHFRKCEQKLPSQQNLSIL